MRDKTTFLLYALIGVVAIGLVGVLSYNFLFASKPVEALDYSTMTTTEINSWCEKNKINVTYSYEFNEEVEKEKQISQTPIATTKLNRGDSLSIVLSLGPDPDFVITLPDFTGYTYTKLTEFVALNKLSDVTYEYVTDDKIATDIFIKHNIATPTMKRSDMIIFTVSEGKEENTTTEITVPDFSSYSKTQINNWAASNNVVIKYATATSNSVEKGGFVKQSPSAGAITYPKRTITVTYSIGKPVSAIDLKGKSKSEVVTWLGTIDNRINVKYVTVYNNDVTKNYVISNSPNSGYIADGATMTVTLSQGKPNLADFTGKNRSELEAAITTLNDNGAKLTVSATEENSDTIAKGKVISNTNGDVAIGSTITVKYSKGKIITASSFADKPENELKTFCTNNRLTANKTGEQYSSITSGNIISNTPNSGTIEEGTTISYVLSLGAVPSLTRKTVSQARNILSGWTVTEVSEWNSATKDTIFEQYDIDYNTKKITVKVSKGPSVTVPNLVGNNCGGHLCTINNYQSFVTSGDFIITTESAGNSNDYKAGQIIQQSVASGSIVAKGTAIKLTYSLGPIEKAELPDFEAMYQEGGNPDTTKSQIDYYMRNTAHFTNYTIEIIDEGATPGTIVGNTTDAGSYDLDYPINIYIQK